MGAMAASSQASCPWRVLATLITQRNAAAGYLHIDDTRWQVFAAVEGKDSQPPLVVLGVRRPGHHGVPHRPVTLAEGPH